MDIIFHGKPNTHSIYATEGINPSLLKKITDVFFESRGGIPNDKALVVETYFWQQKWYSVYTFSLAKLKGNEGRPDSYFSMSLIFPDVFLLLTSAVYQCLEDTYNKCVENKLISNAGKYLIQDFTDKRYFESLITHIQTNFANLQDPLDNSFSTKRSNNEIRYNLQDCDARTFLQELRENGKIIVGNGAEFPKKSAASVVLAKDNEIKKLSAKLAEQEGKINALNTDLTNAQQAANQSASSVKGQLQQLNEKVKSLEGKNGQMKQQLSDKQRELDELVGKISALLPNTKTPDPVPEPVDEDNGLKKYFQYLPLANFVLIVVCICLLLLKNGTSVPPDSAIKELKSQVEQLEKDNKAKDNELDQLQESNRRKAQTMDPLTEEENANQTPTTTAVATTAGAQSSERDMDCNVTIATSTGFAPVKNGSEIINGDKLIIRWTPRENYSWYAYNLHPDSQKKLKEAADKGEVIVPVKYVRSKPDSKPEVIITYRTSNPDNYYPDNKIKLKIKQQ